MSIHFKMNIYCISIKTKQNSLCFRCAFQLFLVQSRKCLKLYSCNLSSQNPIIQSHFSVDSHYKKEACFRRIRNQEVYWGNEDFPSCPGKHRDPIKLHRARDTNVGLARLLRGQMPETGTPRAQCGAQHGILPLGIDILKTRLL